MVSERRLIFSKKPVEWGSRWRHSPLGKTPHKAGVIRDDAMAAPGALLHMTAENGRAAVFEGM